MQTNLFSLGQILNSFDYKSKLNVIIDDSIYLVQKGSVDLYAIETKQDLTHQKKIFLTSRCAGELIFPFPLLPKDIIIEAEVEGNSIIRKIPIKEINDNLKTLLLSDFAKQVDSWIMDIMARLILTTPPHAQIYISNQNNFTQSFELLQTTEIKGPSDKKSKDQITWIKINKGELFLFDQKNMVITERDTPFPITYYTWAQAENYFQVTSFNTQTILKEHDWQTTLFTFHLKIAELVIVFLEKKTKEEVKRYRTKNNLEYNFLQKAIYKILSIFEKPKIFYEKSEDPLKETLQIISHFTNINFDLAKPCHAIDIDNKLFEICENSYIRHRKVILDKDWYKYDSGHILGFDKINQKPVALIRKRYNYEMFSFDHGRNIKITKKNVENLYNFGYTFYPPFAHDEVITNKKALNFCFKNLGPDIFNVILFVIGSILVSFFLPFGISLIFNNIIPTFNKSLFYQVALGLFVTAISGGIFAFISSFSVLRLQSIIRAKFQTALWDRLLRLPLQFFRKFGIGDLQRRAFELFEIQRILSSAFLTSILFGLFSLMYLFIMFYFSPLLALVGFGTVTLIVSTIIFFLIKKIELDTLVLNELGTFNSFMLQIIAGIEKIRFTESESILFSKWSDKYLDIKDKSLKANSYANIMQVLNSALLILGVIVTFLVGLQLINKTISLGSFIAFNSAFGAFSMAIYSATFTMINYFGMIVPRWRRSKVILEHKTEIEENKIDPLMLEGFVELDNVCFKYDEESPIVLDQVSLKAYPGEFIAIVGPTNSGKSSIFKLLLKHYVPQSGSVSIDNKELNDLDIFKVRRQIGSVLQESDIISGTIEDNLFIHDEASYKQALEIMKITEFDEILKNLPLGIKTYIADKGKNFSGGQKQQLLLTRALIRQPKILLLDEATCYLDNKLQKSISSHIEKLKMTRIVISHRLDTIALADKIYVIIKGKIVDVGTFDELIKRNQFFANLVEKQNL